MLPNILTTLRLILVPVFAYSMLGLHNYFLAAAIFVISGLTDIIDGYIARKYNMITDFGKVYDPFVDKLMQICAIICLAVAGIIPWWIIVVVIIKELTMIITGGILYLKGTVVHSSWYGKAATVIFYAVILILIVFKNITPAWEWTLLVIMIIAMMFSALAYLISTIKSNKTKKKVKTIDK